MPLSAGARLGPYEILAALGAGGMGEVYRARDTKLNRDVAIKIVPERFGADPDRLARFEREAQLLAALNHPHIAHIYGVEDTTGVPALVMELVEGLTLADRIAQGPIPLDEALPIANQIIDGLDAAHEQGIIHRDLKPTNIKVRDDGTVKILDFGLARAFDPRQPPSLNATQSPTITTPAVMTGAGAILGSAAYMSPEQARGRVVDKRTDVWAFGCVLYEMLSGSRAFDRETPTEAIAAVLEREPDWTALPSGTPAPLDRLLRRCLDKDPRRRLRDIADARVDLHGAETVDAGGVPSQKSRVRLATAYLTAAVAIVIAGVAVLGRRPALPREPLGPAITRLTWEGALTTEPALSPDGSLLVYASDVGGRSGLDLWVQRVAGGTALRLTSDAADDREPDFSPDGTLITFRSDRNGGGAYVMPVLGGDARLIAPEGRRPRFSPDGTRIAYWVGRTVGGSRVAGSRVFVIGANGGEPTELAKGFASANTPIWSPDGRSLLFFGAQAAPGVDANWDWWWIPAEGGAPTAVGLTSLLRARGFAPVGITNIAGHDVQPGVWTADGVIFAAPLQDAINLWRVDVSPPTGHTTGALVRLTTGAGWDALPTVDRAGRIAFRTAATTEGIFVLALDANSGTSLNRIERVFGEASLLPHRGSVSDNGRWLAFPKHRTTTTELWVADLQAHAERHLVSTPRTTLNPVISGDGSRIAYSVGDAPHVAAYAISAAGGTARKLCDDCNAHAWLADHVHVLTTQATGAGAPDRVRSVDVRSGEGTDLFAVADAHASGTEPRAGFQTPGGVGRPMVTRDGRWLAVGSANRVWIAPVRRGTPATPATSTRLDLGGGAIVVGRHTGWSPDGTLLYVLLGLDGFRCLYAQRIDPAHGSPIGEPFAVHHFHDAKGGIASTPEGNAISDKAFVYDAFETTGGIWMISPPRSR